MEHQYRSFMQALWFRAMSTYNYTNFAAMANNNRTVSLSARHRNEQVDITAGTKSITLEVSRCQCKDVLLEVVDENGQAKGKPLEKWLPQIKQKGVSALRFMMNDFSTQPIEIQITWK